MTIVLMLGSAPNAILARDWDRSTFDLLLAINNAWQVRPDWDYMIHPWDFPESRRPAPSAGQRIITQEDFVPAQNRLGGFVYAGGTMAYTAAYWALDALNPRVLAVMGCDMHYPAEGATHFYGKGDPDPLRVDISLRSLEAKSCRLEALAAGRGTALVNLSDGPSRLTFRRGTLQELGDLAPRLAGSAGAGRGAGPRRSARLSRPVGSLLGGSGSLRNQRNRRARCAVATHLSVTGWDIGEPCRARTGDLLIKSQLLYQLS